MSTPHPEHAATGFYDRASQDDDALLTGSTPLITLLSTKESGRARIFPGYPTTPATEAECPRLTYFIASDTPKVRGFYQVRLQIDEWVWPTGPTGGDARLRDIDLRLLALFDEQIWSFDGARLYAVALSGRRIPAAPDRALHRIRELLIRVSPA